MVARTDRAAKRRKGRPKAQRGHESGAQRSGGPQRPLRREGGGSNLRDRKHRSTPRHRPKEVFRWFREAGLVDIDLLDSDDGWVSVRGRAPGG